MNGTRTSKASLGQMVMNDPAYLHLNGKQFELVKTLHWTPAIVSRGTLCWLARDLEGECPCTGTSRCNLFFGAWSKLTAESELWKLAKDKNVFGCLDILIAYDADVVCREAAGQNPNVIRSSLDYARAPQWPGRPQAELVITSLVLNLERMVHPAPY